MAPLRSPDHSLTNGRYTLPEHARGVKPVVYRSLPDAHKPAWGERQDRKVANR
jgi:hypothetical protein